VNTPKTPVTFDDLFDIRAGAPDMTMGLSPTRIERIDDAGRWQRKAAALRELFVQTLGVEPPLDCELAPEVHDEVDCGSYRKRRVSYQVEPGERVTAWLLLPKPCPGKRPAMICIHPTTALGKEQTIGNEATPNGQDRAYALHLVERGYVTLAYDLLSAGERCYPGCRAFDTAPFYVKHPAWSARGKDIWDFRRAIDFLQAVPEVDADRIGSIGHSQGGGITIDAMGLDERIKVGVSSCGQWPARLSKNPFHHARTGWWVGRPLLRPYCWTGKPFPVDLHELLAMIAPRPIMAITALNDGGYGLDEVEALRPAWSNLAGNVAAVYALMGAEDHFQSLLHTLGHGFLREQRDAAYAFLDAHLKPKA